MRIHRAKMAALGLAWMVTILCPSWVRAQSYTATLVQPAAAGFSGQALNDRREVAGNYLRDGEMAQPAIYRDGTVTPLPLLPGAVGGYARRLNNLGQVVGSCTITLPDSSTESRACLWENGVVTALPLPAGALQSEALDINDAGGVTGSAIMAAGVYPDGTAAYRQDGLVWQGGSVSVMAQPWEPADLYPQAIDAFGRVAVSIPDNWTGGWIPARWTPDVPNGSTGTFEILDPAGATFDINDSGVVCGQNGLEQAVLWGGPAGGVLGVLPEHAWAYASSINAAGTVTGTSTLYIDDGLRYIFEPSAFLGTLESGMRDLNPLVNSTSAPMGRLSAGLAINSGGQILAIAEAGCVILTPSTVPPPLPAPQGLFSAGSVGTVGLAWYPVVVASGYNVKRSTVSGGPYTTIATGVSSTNYTDGAVVNGIRYYYIVTAVDGARESANSNETTARPMTTPLAPTRLAAKVAKAKVTLTWSQSTSPEIERNRVYRSFNGSAYVMIASIPAGLTWSDSSVVSKNNYRYVVTAVNTIGLESPASNAVSATPK
jgi:uncharacterized membrane protein